MLFMALAFATSLGGMGTLLGSPPNIEAMGRSALPQNVNQCIEALKTGWRSRQEKKGYKEPSQWPKDDQFDNMCKFGTLDLWFGLVGLANCVLGSIGLYVSMKILAKKYNYKPTE